MADAVVAGVVVAGVVVADAVVAGVVVAGVVVADAVVAGVAMCEGDDPTLFFAGVDATEAVGNANVDALGAGADCWEVVVELVVSMFGPLGLLGIRWLFCRVSFCLGGDEREVDIGEFCGVDGSVCCCAVGALNGVVC